MPTSFTAWLVNRFGDVIAVLDDGSVHLLDIGVGTFERVAQNRAHFAELVDEGGNVNKWLMIPLVDQCLAAGLVLRPNQCYGYKLPPLLGGEYTVQNVAAVDLAENYAFLSDLWRQTKGLPDGARVRITVK